jgi:hypothetical protein
MNALPSPATFWRLWALLLIGLALAVFAWPTPEAPVVVGARVPAALTRPGVVPPPRDPQPDLALLAQTPLWGPLAARAASAAAAAAPPAPQWFATGIYRTAAGPRLIVHFQDKVQPSQQLQRGDRLPDGRVIVAIEADRVQLQQPARRDGDGRWQRARLEWLAINRSAPLPDNGASRAPSKTPP